VQGGDAPGRDAQHEHLARHVHQHHPFAGADGGGAANRDQPGGIARAGPQALEHVQAGIQEADHHGQAEEHLHEAAGRIEAAVRRGGAGGENQAGGAEGEAHGF
jgi:hypothetical protein